MRVADNRFIKCVHSAKVVRRISRRVPSYGAHGREFMSSHTAGSGPRTNILSALPDAVRN